MDLRDAVVWVTGASSGIGEALVHALAREGSRVILSSRRQVELERVRTESALAPDRSAVLSLDLADLESLPERTDAAWNAFGHVDVVIQSGGVSQRGRAVDTPIAVDRTIMDTNYFGTVAITKAILPRMMERGTGRLVVVSSVLGMFGAPETSGYCASKHALHGFFDALRSEVWRSGIGVTLVCPGYVRTDVDVNALTADGTRQGVRDEHIQRGMSPEQCARGIVNAIRRDREEVIVARYERIGVWVKRFAPGLFSQIIRRARG